jgi:exonuclease VII small subunit
MSQKETINQKLDTLKSKVEWFYSDEFDLSKATTAYKAATTLAKEIEKDLTEMKNDIEVISKDFSK